MNLAELLLDESIDQVWALNTGLQVIAWNKACEIVTGIQKGKILGKNIFDFFPEMKEDSAMMESLNAALKGFKSFLPHNASNGSRHYAEKHIIPLRENGRIIGIMNITRDVAHRVKAENDLKELNRSIEQLNAELMTKHRQLASLNSELKNFTNIAVNSYNETLRQLYLHFEYIVAYEAGKLSDPGKANIRKAQGAIQKMKLLTNDIIAYTRLNEFDGAIVNIELDPVIKTIIHDLKGSIDAAKVKFVIEPLPEIQGYPFLVSLIFHHLLQNALKFRKDVDRLVISISAQQSVKGVSINNEAARPTMNYDVITVRDNGIGFPPERAEEIFQIFIRLNPEKYKGSGIGLAICRKAMELQGGFITAQSVEGEGASFSCYFPVFTN